MLKRRDSPVLRCVWRHGTFLAGSESRHNALDIQLRKADLALFSRNKNEVFSASHISDVPFDVRGRVVTTASADTRNRLDAATGRSE